jgi:hypothetical protein
MFLFMPLQKIYHFTGAVSAFSATAGAAGAAGADAASAGAAAGAGATTGSTLTSSFLPHATKAVATKANTIAFFILFSVS